jgi:glycosyltransferase involved in cell wall biosynthesis
MHRIAYASPINPAPSGISDYSEELLPYLSQYADLTVYVEDGLRPTNQALAQQFAVRPISRLEQDNRRRPYDAIVYHIGNSPVHAGIWTALRRLSGVVVLHECVLHHFMLNYAATVLRDVSAYEAEAAQRYGAEGERVARLMTRGRFTDAAFDFPFCEAVLDAADGLITHSRYVLDRAAEMRPNLPAAHVPMGVPLPPLIERDAARARLGLPLDAPILASFGHINPYKRLEPTLRAVQTLRAEYPGLRYVLVGSISPNYDVRAVIARSGVEDAVTVTGYVERAAFEDYVAAADICLNLRHPTAGETSASLLRLLGAGKPTLVTATGSFTELPADVAAQVDPDLTEGDLILAYCRLLLSRPELAAALGANARNYVAREHTLEVAAARYMRFLSERYGWGPLDQRRTTNDERPTTNDGGRRTNDQRRTTTKKRTGGLHAPTDDQRRTTTEKCTGGLHTPTSIAQTLLAAALGEAIAGVGATEDDAALLDAATRALTEIAAENLERH